VSKGSWNTRSSTRSDHRKRLIARATGPTAGPNRGLFQSYNCLSLLCFRRRRRDSNRDRLMSRVAERISDKRLLTLIRAFLKAGVMEKGLVRPVDEGTPQGGPLSPLLSNLVLDDLDRELTRRGHRFCRYADDCSIYVRSRRAGERVMASVSRFVSTRLRLKVNESKSAVARPQTRSFLGFRITNDGSQREIAPKALARFKARVHELTRRTRHTGSQSIEGGRVSGSLPHRLAWLLRLLPTPPSALRPRRTYPPQTADVPLAPMVDRSQALPGAAVSRYLQVPGCGRGRVTDGLLAHV
jgi:hypothetical protein